MRTARRSASRCLLWSVVPLFLLLSVAALEKRTRYPFPPMTELVPNTPSLVHLGGILAGLRRLTADIAWIQVLQYYGTPESTASHELRHHREEAEYGRGAYAKFFGLCQRVVRIDPYFSYAYLYGAGVLAWNLERPEEAIVLLQEGVQRLPHYWRFHMYLAAIAYKQRNEYAKMRNLLEETVKQPDCPNVIRSILANLYKTEKRYPEALRLWIQILDTSDPEYHQRARDQIHELSPRD